MRFVCLIDVRIVIRMLGLGSRVLRGVLEGFYIYLMGFFLIFDMMEFFFSRYL